MLKEEALPWQHLCICASAILELWFGRQGKGVCCGPVPGRLRDRKHQRGEEECHPSLSGAGKQSPRWWWEKSSGLRQATGQHSITTQSPHDPTKPQEAWSIWSFYHTRDCEIIISEHWIKDKHKHIPTFRGLWVMNHQLTTEPDSKQNPLTRPRTGAFGFLCMCENGVGSDLRDPRGDQGHDMRRPQSSSRSLNSQFPRLLWLDRVCLINITRNDCCLSGLYHLDRGHLSSGLRTKWGEKKIPVRKEKKTQNMEETPERRREEGALAPDGQNRCHLSRQIHKLHSNPIP